MDQRIVAADIAAILAYPLAWERFAGRRVLLTGVTGLIGGYLLEAMAALQSGRDCAPVRIYALARDREKLQVRHGRLLGRDDIAFLVQDVAEPIADIERVDYIVHTASPASPKRYLADPVGTVQANVAGTRQLLELARSHGARLLYLSSGTVYGNAVGDDGAIAEDRFGPYDPLDARACYTESKRLAETLCASYARQYGVAAVIARLSHTYGPGADLTDGRVFSDFVADAVAGRPIALLGDGSDSRPFLYLADAIQALLLLLLEGRPGQAYNVGAEQETSMHELAAMIARLAGGADYPIARHGVAAVRPPAPRKTGHFDIGKLKALGWQPSTPPEVGFRRMLDYYRSQGG